MKQRGFAQGIFEQSSSRKELLGEKRMDHLGDVWVYARCGTTAIPAGRLTVGVAIAVAHQNEVITTAYAIGSKVLDVTVTAGTAIVADELKGGQFIINDATGEGHSYEIDSNTAITTATTGVSITLKRGLKVALDTTSEFTLVRPKVYGAIQSTTQTLPIIGVTPIAVTPNYYFWARRSGVCGILTDTTTTTTGALFAQGGSVGGTVTVSTNSDTIPDLGQCLYAAAASEYSVCDLWLE